MPLHSWIKFKRRGLHDEKRRTKGEGGLALPLVKVRCVVYENPITSLNCLIKNIPRNSEVLQVSRIVLRDEWIVKQIDRAEK
jgi:hypothetical protein